MAKNEQGNKTQEILTNEEELKVNENFEEGGFNKNLIYEEGGFTKKLIHNETCTKKSTLMPKNNENFEEGDLSKDLIHNEPSTKKSTLMPKNDVVFQTLFTRGADNITKALIEDIIKTKIKKIDLDKSKDLVNDSIRSKNGRLDVRAELNGNIDCDIEMQLVPHDKMVERFLYYWAKMYTANIKQGEGYNTLKKAISIIILDTEIPLFEKIPKAHTEWRIIEKNNEKVILTDYFEMHIIVISKAIKEYENNKDDEVLQWMMFLNNPENSEVSEIMKVNNDIKEAKVELDKISQDERIRRAALNEEIAMRDDYQRIYDATQKGIKQGKSEIVKKLASMEMPIKKIAEAVELSDEEVKKILAQENI